MKMNRLFVLGALVGASAMAGAVNLVTNGGFETVNTGGANGSGTGYWVFNGGNTNIGSWSVGGTSVDIVDTTYPVHSGNYALDLVGTPGPGSISQSLSTSNGWNHVISFWARWTGSTLNQTVKVTLGADTQTVTLGAADTWELVTRTFTNVVGSSNTLTLESLPNNTTNGNTFIDDLTASPVPEPATLALCGLALAAAARRRKR
jgi:hypothetical protein